MLGGSIYLLLLFISRVAGIKLQKIPLDWERLDIIVQSSTMFHVFKYISSNEPRRVRFSLGMNYNPVQIQPNHFYCIYLAYPGRINRNMDIAVENILTAPPSIEVSVGISSNAAATCICRTSLPPHARLKRSINSAYNLEEHM